MSGSMQPPANSAAALRDGAASPASAAPQASSGSPSGSPSPEPAAARVARAPRNPWARLAAALEEIAAGDLDAAHRHIEGVREHPALTPALLAPYRAQLRAALDRAGRTLRTDSPADYLARPPAGLCPPFRRLDPAAAPPSPFPPGLALPEFPGAGNAHGFLREAAAARETTARETTAQKAAAQKAAAQKAAAQKAAAQKAATGEAAARPLHLHVVYSPVASRDASGKGSDAALAALAADLAAQDHPGRIDLTVCAAGIPATATAPAHARGRLTHIPGHLLDPAVQAPLATALARPADAVVFLTGRVRLDRGALARMAHLLRASDRLVLPLVPAETEGPDLAEAPTLLATRAQEAIFATAYPFRRLNGLNLALPAGLLARTGLPDPRFCGSFLAARELAFRLWNAGAWFAPVKLPQLDGWRESPLAPADAELCLGLAPNHWDRKQDGRFERPRVSVYIPAWNAESWLERAIDSVLTQDVEDLEICVADDGSTDGTVALLQRLAAEDSRLRWTTGPNGGIGRGSNRALQMTRGLYIGQLDSDDCLRPGAIRRLADFLDEHPEVACAYGSAERIDAEGRYLKKEYSWPVFSREKMMVTSIAHHFRMFRRAAWARTTGFREDIVNAVDYDMFLQLSEIGPFHHIDEVLYRRRWHGRNTSAVNEDKQTTNTWRVQRAALERLGLDRFWDVHVPDPDNPRRVGYRRRDGRPMLVFWPDYSRANPYQRLLYARAASEGPTPTEVVAGPPEAALRLIKTGTVRPEALTFHLHWLNYLFKEAADADAARANADALLARLTELKKRGARIVWTLHNTLSHDAPFPQIERELSTRLAALADVLHLHASGARDEVAQVFPVPAEKVRIARHGHYIGVYPDFVTRAAAREMLGLAEDEDVILFAGQLRGYKGLDRLVETFRRLLPTRPRARLLLAGAQQADPFADLATPLGAAERDRIRLTPRFLEEAELQVFHRAADVAALPYRSVLTSGSLMLALSFGLPAVAPSVAMTRAVLGGTNAGRLFDPADPEGLATALSALLAAKDAGDLPAMSAAARATAEANGWANFAHCLQDGAPHASSPQGARTAPQPGPDPATFPA